ncbi:MAG: ABC transporter permease [Acidobacteriia bacterium]|nr:ABC transporter permease [Terriglobia bacterium]
MNLDDEIRDFIERETEENIAQGMDSEMARSAARRKFGNISRVKEDTRAVWRRVWIEQIWQDARYAARTMLRAPWFSASVVATLAVAIGLNTAVFSVVNAVLLRGLAYPEAERLVWINSYEPNLKRDFTLLPDYVAWRKEARSFEAITAFSPQQAAIQTPGGAVQMNGLETGGDFWRIVNPSPALGRVFGADEQNAIVLTWDFFEREFAGDRAIVGSAVRVDGKPVTVTGVLAEDFRFQFPTWWGAGRIDAYTSFTPAELQGRAGAVVARLKPGVPMARGLAEVQVIEQRQVALGTMRRPFTTNVYATPLAEKLTGTARRGLVILSVSGIFVLLIAAANIANLLLARASARQRELAIRVAVGGGRMRIARQLGVENLVFAMVAGAVGLAMARWTIALFVRIAPDAVPRLREANIDGRVLVFTLLVAVAASILFSIAAAISVWRNDLHTRLKDGSRGSLGLAGMRLRQILVAAELALAIVLVAAAGLMLKSDWRMNQRPAGFSPDQILTLTVRPTPGDHGVFFGELLRRVQRLPGVRSAGISTWLLFGAARFPVDQENHVVRINASSPDYPRAMGMRLEQGRWLAEGDDRAVLMNESMAREAFGDRDPVGQQVKIPNAVTVVGVVADLRYSKLDAAPAPEIYAPFAAVPGRIPSVTFAISSANPASLGGAVRKTLAELDPSQAAYDVKTLETSLAESITTRRFNLLLLGVFAAVALLLAMVGVYGVIAYSVSERTREIGVRMALGARAGKVVGMVVTEGLRVSLAGITVGIAAAFGLTRILANLLYEVRPDDPWIFGAVAGALLMTTLAACAVPARRASKVDPVVALRCD